MRAGAERGAWESAGAAARIPRSRCSQTQPTPRAPQPIAVEADPLLVSRYHHYMRLAGAHRTSLDGRNGATQRVSSWPAAANCLRRDELEGPASGHGRLGLSPCVDALARSRARMRSCGMLAASKLGSTVHTNQSMAPLVRVGRRYVVWRQGHARGARESLAGVDGGRIWRRPSIACRKGR